MSASGVCPFTEVNKRLAQTLLSFELVDAMSRKDDETIQLSAPYFSIFMIYSFRDNIITNLFRYEK